MTTRRKPRQEMDDDDAPPSVAVSMKLLKWLGGIAASLLAIGALLYGVGNWVDNRYLMATIANQREEKHTAEFKALSDKYDMQLLALAKDAQRGRAWLIFSVADLKTLVLEGRVDDCREKKKDCIKAETAHARAQSEADNMKRAAVEVSK